MGFNSGFKGLKKCRGQKKIIRIFEWKFEQKCLSLQALKAQCEQMYHLLEL